MKRFLLILSVPCVCALAFLLDGAAQSGGSRPDPIPEVSSMVFVPAGDFLMGSTVKDLNNKASVDEFPQRRVWVDDFYIDIHEVTNAQFKYYVDSTKVEPPSRWRDGLYPLGHDGYPVTSITYQQAEDYARFMGKRLPTEEEWEKAARGRDGRRFPWGNDFDPTRANNGEHLLPIMSVPEGVSPYGVYDMAGNAAEWVDSWYQRYPRGEDDVLPADFAAPDKDFPRPGKFRVYRGGSWNSFGSYLRCANREREKPNRKWMYIGFRCVMDPPWKD